MSGLTIADILALLFIDGTPMTSPYQLCSMEQHTGYQIGHSFCWTDIPDKGININQALQIMKTTTV